MFDDSMGAYDGAEVSELVGLQILSKINEQYPKLNFGLYRDGGLGESLSSRTRDQIRKKLIALFKEVGLKITTDFGLGIVNFLDVTLNFCICICISIINYPTVCVWVCGFVCDRTPPKRRLQS